MTSDKKYNNAMDDPRVTAYAFGQLEGQQLREFESMLSSNPEYAAAVENTKQLVNLLEADAAHDLATFEPLVQDRNQSLEKVMQMSAAPDDKFSEAEISVAKRDGNSWLGIAAAMASAAALIGVLIWNGYDVQTIDALADNTSRADEIVVSDELSSAESNSAELSKQLSELQSANAAIAQESEQSELAVASSQLSRSATEASKSSAPVTAPVTNEQASNTKNFSGQTTTITNQNSTASNKPASSAANAPFEPATQLPAVAGGIPVGTGGARGMGVGNNGGMMRGYGDMMGGGYRSAEDYAGGAPYSGEKGYGAAGGYPGGPSTPRPTVAPTGEGGLPDDVLYFGDPGSGHPAEPKRRFESESRRKDMPGLDRFEILETKPSYYYPLPKHGSGGDSYAEITDNAFQKVTTNPLSTFSIDVDTASYSKMRMMLQQYNRLPPANAVRIEELLNYFEYDYEGPGEADVPFAANMELASCPWNDKHKLARIAIKGKEIENSQRTVSNLVFLLDVSGSMNEPNKLPLVRRGMEMLVGQLGENDRVAIVVYAGAAGQVLESTTADNKDVIFEALDRLQAGGSTNGGQGIQLAYQIARDHFIKGGTNRVILCTDGDFNVGTTGTDQLVNIVEQEAKGGVFLSVLGFGTGNLNDAMLEAISGRGDGNYAFIDTSTEAHKVLVEQLSGTLVAIAKDVKIQIEFNPALVDSYRLIGYENRILAAEDFADDTKDAGEIGAGHTVTALYEIVPAGTAEQNVTDLKYQPQNKPEVKTQEANEFQDEILTLKLRYKAPEGGSSKLLEFPIKDAENAFEDASSDFRFAAAVAEFGMLLRNSPHRGEASFEHARSAARGSLGEDRLGLRAEFLGLIDAAKRLK